MLLECLECKKLISVNNKTKICINKSGTFFCICHKCKNVLIIEKS